MKVLFYIRHYFDTWGGIEENVSSLSRYLKENYIVSITSSAVNFSHREYQKEIIYINHSNVKVKDYDVILIENFEILPHFFLCINIVISKIIKKRNGTKIILVPHGGFTLNWKLFSFYQRLIKIIYNKIFGLWFINNFCDQIVAVSDWEKKALIKKGIKTGIVVIRNGYNPNNFNVENKKKDNYFVFLGRIDPIKNIEDILSTFSTIVKDEKFSNYKLKIIGDYNSNLDYTNKLKGLIERHSISNLVDFVGPKYNKEKYSLIAEAKCLFCLSHMENDPVVIKEAFSVKTKVLINNNFGLGDFVNEKNVFIKKSNNFNISSFFNFVNSDFDNNLAIPLHNWKEVSGFYENIF